jgi:hypothetical protein
MRPDVVFTVIFLKDGKHVATPTVLGEFGSEVRVEIPAHFAINERFQIFLMRDGLQLSALVFFSLNGR